MQAHDISTRVLVQPRPVPGRLRDKRVLLGDISCGIDILKVLQAVTAVLLGGRDDAQSDDREPWVAPEAGRECKGVGTR